MDLDLRWGVTEEEAERGKVVEVVFDEIDRSRPFFIGLLGERYGSVPSNVPEDTQRRYSWLRDYDGCSLTALEIIHGVLRKPEQAQGSFFYFRDPRAMTQIPKRKRRSFVAESPKASRRLLDLKEKIRVSGRPVLEYPCRWSDNKERLVGLDLLGQRVLEDLWGAICREYPEEKLGVDPLAVERQMHENFAEERSYLHIGRLKEAEELTKYVCSNDPRPVVITGKSGSGKSAFLANWYRQYAIQHPDDYVLSYFIGASADSTNHHKLIRNMCEELKRKFELAYEMPQDDEKLSDALTLMLANASRGKARASHLQRLQQRPSKPRADGLIVIVLDALNQLSPSGDAHGLTWLLDYVPEKVRLVMSSLESDCLDVLRRRGVEEIALRPLEANERRQIVKTLLDLWGRKMDGRQINALCAHREADNPLYLRVSLQELRLFGAFKQLKTRIESMAEDIPSLFDQVLKRLEEDHGNDLVEEAFSMLGCSRYGLSEAELLDLLKRKGDKQLPRVLWARLSRSPNMREYLVQRGELVGFFHQQLSDAVVNRYLSKARAPDKHGKLATYFEHAPLERKLDEYPFQLERSRQWQALATALSDLEFFQYAWENGRDYEWVRYWRSLKGRFKPKSCYQTALEARENVEGETGDIALFSCSIGHLLSEMELHSSALPFYQRALAIRERTFGSNDPLVARTLSDMATSYYGQGRIAKAFDLDKRALRIMKRICGPKDPRVAEIVYRLAVLYASKGDNKRAMAFYYRAFKIFVDAFGFNHPDVSLALCGAADVAYRDRMYDYALQIYEQALASMESVYGPDHPRVAKILSDMILVYYEKGEYNKVLDCIDRALATMERVYGPDHPRVADIYERKAFIFHDLGNFEEAENLYLRAFSIRDRTYGPKHPTLTDIFDNMALVYKEKGEYGKALYLHERAIAKWKGIYGLIHPDVARALNNIASIYQMSGNYREALWRYQTAVRISSITLGSDHQETKKYRRNSKICKNELARSLIVGFLRWLFGIERALILLLSVPWHLRRLLLHYKSRA